MIKYIIKNLPLPNNDIVDIIYSYLDLLVELKRKRRFGLND